MLVHAFENVHSYNSRKEIRQSFDSLPLSMWFMLTQVFENWHSYNSRKDLTQLFDSLLLSMWYMLTLVLENVHSYNSRQDRYNAIVWILAFKYTIHVSPGIGKMYTLIIA